MTPLGSMASEGSPPPAFGATLVSANENVFCDAFSMVWFGAAVARRAGGAPDAPRVAGNPTSGAAPPATARMTRLLACTPAPFAPRGRPRRLLPGAGSTAARTAAPHPGVLSRSWMGESDFLRRRYAELGQRLVDVPLPGLRLLGV